MFPVERQIRERMKGGAAITRDEARLAFGPLGEVYFRRLVRCGAARLDDRGAAYLVERQPDPVAAQRAREERERAAALRRRSEEERAAAVALTQRREAERRAQLRALDAAKTPEERARLIQEGRILQLAERAPKDAPDSGDPLLDLFAQSLDLDVSVAS